jgi:hypothetical protein
VADRYILAEDGRTPKLSHSLMEWALYFEHTNRQTAEDVIGDVRVSTVFLGLDHQWGKGPPLLWETMIFGGEHDDYTDRYASHDEAIAGHARAVALVRGTDCEACGADVSAHEPGCRESPDWEPSDDDLDLNGEGVAARDEALRRELKEAGR